MTDSPSWPSRVLIVGAGAIGAFYGAALQRQGAEVSIVCRSDYEAVRAAGYRIKSDPLGELLFRPVQTLQSAADYQGGPPDFLIVTVKVVDGVDRVALIRDAVGPATTIVLIENGIDIEPEIAEAFPQNEIVSAIAYIQVSRTGPGLVRHYAFGELTLGRYPSGLSARCRELGAMMEAGGVTIHLSEEVGTARWKKALWNAVLNPISALGGVFDTAQMFAAPAGEAMIRRAMQEVCAIAAASGHPLPPTLMDQFIDKTRNGPAYKTSMALDYENRRPMEVEAILGNAVRAGQRLGLAIPVLETLYGLLRMAEAKNRTTAKA
jgi:2-dehydropantoate 2-reductase